MKCADAVDAYGVYYKLPGVFSNKDVKVSSVTVSQHLGGVPDISDDRSLYFESLEGVDEYLLDHQPIIRNIIYIEENINVPEKHMSLTESFLLFSSQNDHDLKGRHIVPVQFDLTSVSAIQTGVGQIQKDQNGCPMYHVDYKVVASSDGNIVDKPLPVRVRDVPVRHDDMQGDFITNRDMWLAFRSATSLTSYLEQERKAVNQNFDRLLAQILR